MVVCALGFGTMNYSSAFHRMSPGDGLRMRGGSGGNTHDMNDSSPNAAREAADARFPGVGGPVIPQSADDATAGAASSAASTSSPDAETTDAQRPRNPHADANLPAIPASNRLESFYKQANGESARGVRLRLGWKYTEKPKAPERPRIPTREEFDEIEAEALAQNAVDPHALAQALSAEALHQTAIWRSARTRLGVAAGVAVLAGLVGTLMTSAPIIVGIMSVVFGVVLATALLAYAATGVSPRLTLAQPTTVGGASVVVAGVVGFSGMVFPPLSLVTGAGAAAMLAKHASRAEKTVSTVNQTVNARIAEGFTRQTQHVELVQQKRRDAENRIAQAHARFGQEVESWQQAKTWHPVRLRTGGSRLDVVGGTPMGWSAMLLTACGDVLEAGGQVTVIDLSELSTAQEVVDVTRAVGGRVDVRNLPRDLDRLDIGESLDRAALVDILTNVVHDADPNGRREDWAANAAIIDKIAETLGNRASVARIIAGLRVILREEQPPRDDNGLLTFDEFEALSSLYGDKVRSAGVDQKCFNLLNQLQGLSKLGINADYVAGAPLRVISLDPEGTDLGNAVLGDFVTHACVRQLRTAGFDHGFESTIVIVGADRMSTRNLDQISRYADKQGVGLILFFQKLTDDVNAFIGSGDASIAFMRMGNGKEAKYASEQIGVAPRFVMSQITENVSTSVTDTIGDSYTVTDGTSSGYSDGINDSFSTSNNTNYGSGGGVIKKESQGSGDSASDSFGTNKGFNRGISYSTAWGTNTSRAIGDTTGESRTLQRSKESLVEIHELQTLPQTAFILVDMNTSGGEPRIMLGDANPAITALDSVADVDADHVAEALDPADEYALPAGSLNIPSGVSSKYQFADAYVVSDPVVRGGKVRDAKGPDSNR